MSRVVNSKQLTQLELRLVNVRKGLAALSKRGMGTQYYLKELAIMENNIRAARSTIEKMEWPTLEVIADANDTLPPAA